MAKVIIGGQVLSLALALVVTPVFYALLDKWTNFTRRIGIRFSVDNSAHGALKSSIVPAPIGRNGEGATHAATETVL